MLGEQGGWPLTIFLTPDGEPFWGGTYFPAARGHYGRPGFPDVLGADRSSLYASRKTRSQRTWRRFARASTSWRRHSRELAVHGAGDARQRARDDRRFALSIRYAAAPPGRRSFRSRFSSACFGAPTGARMRLCSAKPVVLTLDAHVQGRHLRSPRRRFRPVFHGRREWLAPHFEKMLYDNALLIELLTEVWRRDTRSSLLYARARPRDGRHGPWRKCGIDHPTGDETFAFASALDANSEGVEGKYYVWSAAEIDRCTRRGCACVQTYPTTCRPGGNWEGHTILNLSGAPDIQAVLADEKLAAARGPG